MKITGDTKLADIRDYFHKRFPYLQLEFYAQPHQQGEKTPEEFRLSPDLRVRDVCQKSRSGFFTLDEDMKVGTFEEVMHDMFGLNVQVFRKSYKEWLQTWSTDMWSLKEQNHRGQIMGNGPMASS